MQSENHDSGEHDTTLEPDADIKAGPVFAWGIAMFGAVIVSIVLLTGYFWMHQREAMTAKQGGKKLFALAQQNSVTESPLTKRLRMSSSASSSSLI